MATEKKRGRNGLYDGILTYSGCACKPFFVIALFSPEQQPPDVADVVQSGFGRRRAEKLPAD